MKEMILEVLSPTSPYAVLIRAGIWFIVSIVIIAATDTPNGNPRNLKENIGMFLLFLVVSSGLLYLLFGFVPIA